MILRTVLGREHEVKIKHSKVFQKINISLGTHDLEQLDLLKPLYLFNIYPIILYYRLA